MKRKIKMLVAAICATVTALSTSVLAFADTGTVSYSDLSSVVDVLKSQINITTIIGVIAGIGGVCVALAFFWWGIRKVISMVMSAFKKGKVSA